MLPLDGGAVSFLSIQTSDQTRIMVGGLADYATLGGAVALPTSEKDSVKATTNYLAAYKQRWLTRSLTRQQ